MRRSWMPSADSVETAYRAYRERVFGFALRMTGNRADAEDLLQETFVAAQTSWGAFQGRSSRLSWLLGIAARRWGAGVRRDRAREAILVAAGAPEAPEATPHPEPGIVEGVALQEALNALDAPLREALLLVASQQLSYREAAEALGAPVGTVKWRVHEACRRMRELLRSGEEGGDGMR